eukprot:EG_transcript_44486
MQVPGCLTSLDPTTPPREGRNLGMAGHYHESSPNHLMHILVGFGEVSGHACGGTSLKRFRVPTAGIQCQGCDTDPQESTGQRGRHTTTKGRGADGTVSGVEGLQM